MARTVQCIKLHKESEGLEKPPFKGELGQKVFDTVSKDAWRQWLEHSKMLINEYRLDVTSECSSSRMTRLSVPNKYLSLIHI